MKFLRVFTAALTLLTTSAFAQFEEGVHYTTLDLPKTSAPELREYFSFFCPACKNMESYLPLIERELDENTKLTKTHAHILRGASKQVQAWIGVGYEAAVQVGWEKRFTQALFRHIQDDRKPFVGESSLFEIFVTLGMDEEDTKKLIGSFTVRSLGANHMKLTEKLSSAGGLDAVPTFIAHGKYKLNMKALSEGDFSKNIAQITSYLTKY
ncbi:MAG: thiol:disulfide interchange protein DsbA [Oleiphilaceae bacterium]|jgi:thiol:disulfide interchange protein DsbA